VLDLAEVPESVTSLTRRVAREEGLRRFLAEVEALPHEDRELLVICGLEGRPASEAAQQLDLTHEAARKRWLRLRERLAERAELAALID
jgi:DNA-directed RNA polymerase specialized sigma24 family protein